MSNKCHIVMNSNPYPDTPYGIIAAFVMLIFAPTSNIHRLMMVFGVIIIFIITTVIVFDSHFMRRMSMSIIIGVIVPSITLTKKFIVKIEERFVLTSLWFLSVQQKHILSYP